MNKKMHILCLLNPVAGSGISIRRWPEVASLLGSFGITYDLVAEKDVPLGVQVARRIDQEGSDRYGAIVGVGGDGTHSSIINGLMRYRNSHPGCELPPYALIPMGTGNDIAKSFGLNSRQDFFVSDLRQAVATILYGADYMIDLGFLADTYFVDALTVGLDSSILKEHNRRKQKIARFPVLSRILKGHLLYTWCVGLMFWRQNALEAEIKIDGASWYSGPIINLVINNTRVYAGEFVICPDAYANDGVLEVVVFTGHRDYLRKYLLAFRNNPREIQKMGERLSSVSSYTKGERIEVRLSRPAAAQFDGEEISARTDFDVSVEPRTFHIRIPSEPA
ncbi:diacylglycerol/lipid kinase family protein [Verrucomicrobiota bacterium]